MQMVAGWGEKKRHKYRAEMTQGGWEGTVDGDYLARTEPMNEWLQLYVLMMRLKTCPKDIRPQLPETVTNILDSKRCD